jgi:MFS family permease
MKESDLHGFSPVDLLPLFLVSLFSISFETMLTRYFAVTLYSEYSYWIISIAMVGYSLSGVVLTMAKDHFLKRKSFYFLAIPPLLLAFGVAAFFLLQVNPFNPLKLQNEVLWTTQIADVLLYYGGLFPVFFLAGLYVGFTFMVFYRQVTRAYAFDLLGAAVGSVFVLLFMFILHPFHLLAAIFPVAFIVIVWSTLKNSPKPLAPRFIALVAASFAVLALGEYYVLRTSTMSVSEFKKLHAILAIDSTKVDDARLSPSGSYLVLDDYLEFDDVEMTNNYEVLKIGAPPRSYGLYKDNDRITSLVKSVPEDRSYVSGSLAYFPYTIRDRPPILLIGTNGGFLLYERPASGGSAAIEAQASIYSLVRERLDAQASGDKKGQEMRLANSSMFAFLQGSKDKFSVIEIASSFLSQDDTNEYAFTTEAMLLYLRSLSAGGILSIPVDITEFNVYALKVVNTIVTALGRLGVTDPSRNLMVYRTAWACRILASNEPFSGRDVDALKRFCDARSFDTSYYPGIVPSSLTIWNDLPPVSFEEGTVGVSDKAQDALMDDLVRSFSSPAGAFTESRFFDLSPSTVDRPSMYSITRLSKLPAFVSNLSLMPRREVGYLLNVIVLAQALVFALLILFLPLAALRRRGRRAAAAQVPAALFARIGLYFTSLGLGFFFIELTLIEKLSFFLGSATASFGIVLTVMLVFSGLGSLQASRFTLMPYRGLVGAMPVIGGILLFILLGLDPILMRVVGAPMELKLLIVVAVVAPLSFAMGRPFPLGSSSLGERSETLIPWAWAINGAFSVIATPLANIVSARIGWAPIIAAALLLYLSTLLSFPMKPKSQPV